MCPASRALAGFALDQLVAVNDHGHGQSLEVSGAGLLGLGLSSSIVSFGGGYIIAAFGFPALFLTSATVTAAGALLLWAYLRKAP